MLKCRRLPDRTRLSAPLVYSQSGDDEDVMTTVERVFGK
jgi:hypothetical protein